MTVTSKVSVTFSHGSVIENKNALIAERVLISGGEGGIRISSLPWGPATESKTRSSPFARTFFRGGEGGIRTRDWFYPALT